MSQARLLEGMTLSNRDVVAHAGLHVDVVQCAIGPLEDQHAPTSDQRLRFDLPIVDLQAQPFAGAEFRGRSVNKTANGLHGIFFSMERRRKQRAARESSSSGRLFAIGWLETKRRQRRKELSGRRGPIAAVSAF